jgi:Protein of unknown function (DUF559)
MPLWSHLPIGRVVRVADASPAALALTLVLLPDDAPAIVTYRPRSAASTADTAAAALDELETVALGLFPAWLPDAEGIDGPGGAGVAAVRELAMRSAVSTSQFGPFLADLAERALRRAPASPGRFSPKIRAAGLAKMIARSYRRPATAVLVEVPDGLTGGDAQALVGACEWLAHRGGLGVWLAGAELPTVDWLMTVRVRLPDAVTSLEREVVAREVVPRGAAGRGVAGREVVPRGVAGREVVPRGVAAREGAAASPEPSLPIVLYPPLAGRPHPSSTAERLLEEALAPLPWAAGRAWNQTYHSHPLGMPVRLDLVWRRERCVVEVDGPEHREPLRFEADRRRDARLQLDGYAVLRFTNAQVTHELAVVVSQIERLVQARRLGVSEGQQYARQG